MKISIDQIHSPEDIRGMTLPELDALCAELRKTLVQTVSKTGGHLSSNLGVVELTVALHKMLDTPRDRIVWDVGHQCYVHKLLTGRSGRFDTLRQTGGISGFPKPEESEYVYRRAQQHRRLGGKWDGQGENPVGRQRLRGGRPGGRRPDGRAGL